MYCIAYKDPLLMYCIRRIRTRDISGKSALGTEGTDSTEGTGGTGGTGGREVQVQTVQELASLRRRAISVKVAFQCCRVGNERSGALVFAGKKFT